MTLKGLCINNFICVRVLLKAQRGQQSHSRHGSAARLSPRTPQRNESPGKLYGSVRAPLLGCRERRGVPGRQGRQRERIPLHTDSHVFLWSVPLRYHAGLLSLQEEGEEEDQRLHAPGARGGAEGVGGSAQEAQRPLPGHRLGAAGHAGFPAVLRYPWQPLRGPAPRGLPAVSAGLRAVRGAEQRQLPVLLRRYAPDHRGGGGRQRRGGGAAGEPEGSASGAQRRRFRLNFRPENSNSTAGQKMEKGQLEGKSKWPQMRYYWDPEGDSGQL